MIVFDSFPLQESFLRDIEYIKQILTLGKKLEMSSMNYTRVLVAFYATIKNVYIDY